MLIKANRGEYLVQESLSDRPKLMAIERIPHGKYSGIGSANDFENESISIQ